MWNAEGRWQGHAQIGLSAKGRAQAADVARELAADPPDAVYSSDLARARETAEIIAAKLGLPVTLDARLREIDVGEWAGLTRDEVAARFPGASRWRDGETHEAMGARILTRLHELAAEHQGERVLVVTHGGPIRVVRVEGGVVEELEISNCHVQRVRFEAGKITRVD